MNPEVFDTLRHYLLDALRQHGDTQDMADNDSLFLSGRLDSFSMMNLILFLESRFQLSFSDLEFDVEKVDTLDAIAALVQAKSKGLAQPARMCKRRRCGQHGLAPRPCKGRHVECRLRWRIAQTRRHRAGIAGPASTLHAGLSSRGVQVAGTGRDRKRLSVEGIGRTACQARLLHTTQTRAFLLRTLLLVLLGAQVSPVRVV